MLQCASLLQVYKYPFLAKLQHLWNRVALYRCRGRSSFNICTADFTDVDVYLQTGFHSYTESIICSPSTESSFNYSFSILTFIIVVSWGLFTFTVLEKSPVLPAMRIAASHLFLHLGGRFPVESICWVNLNSQHVVYQRQRLSLDQLFNHHG